MTRPMPDAELRRAADYFKGSPRVLVLTGAGVSAESGVPTFRASDGLWEGHRIEDVATPDGFARDPALVWQFYNARRANVALVSPNPGHVALARLEAELGDRFLLATQNVDGLHLDAGSKRVLELHGSLRRTRCLSCKVVADRGLEVLANRPICPACGGFLRPDIVWFHEMLPPGVMEAAQKFALQCDILIVVGTSAVVYPAAGLIDIVRDRGDYGGRPAGTILEFNLEPTAVSDLVDVGVFGPSGQTLPRLLELIGGG